MRLLGARTGHPGDRPVAQYVDGHGRPTGICDRGAGGTVHVTTGSLTNHECNENEWHFIINQIDEVANAPASIHVIVL